MAALASAVVCSWSGPVAADDPPVLPIRTAYGVHANCPDADAFLTQVLERTPLARKAGPEEAAETLVVTITRHGDDSVGKLVMVDRVGTTSTRKVLAATCGEVVSALALVAALTIDPAATGATPDQAEPAEVAPSVAGEASASQTPGVEPAVSDEQTSPVTRQPEQPTGSASTETTPADRKLRKPPRGSTANNPIVVGAGLDLATTYDSPTLAPRLFGQLPVATGFLPSAALRLSVHTSHNDANSRLGTAEFRWVMGRLEACPWRAELSSSLGVRPCGSTEAGWLRSQSDYADEGGSITRTSSTTRLWLASTALLRAELDVMDWVRLEADSGVTVPWRRYAFSFQEDGNEVKAREIPAAGGFVGIGAGVVVR